VAIYEGPPDLSGIAEAITVDGSKNVYVTGDIDWSYGGICTIKYDEYGNDIWVAFREPPEHGIDVLVDDLGYVYVLSTKSTIKYDSNGNDLWVTEFPGNANAFCLDDNGYIYVSGYDLRHDAPPPFETYAVFITVKYDNDGNEVWVGEDGQLSDMSHTPELISNIGLDIYGNVFVGGTLEDTTGTNTLIKYDNNGSKQWIQTYDNIPIENMNVNEYGDIYSTGADRRYDPYIVTAKFDSQGSIIWSESYVGGDYCYPEALALDTLGNVYLTGVLADTVTLRVNTAMYCTIKYDTNGNEEWVVFYNEATRAHGRAIAIGEGRNVYVTGNADGDYCTIKYVDYPNNPPNPFNFLAPPDGAEVPEPVTLDWEDSTDDDGDTITYDVWYATNPSFDPHDEVNGLTDSTYTFPEGVLIQGETYYWKVRAWDGYEGTWSGPDEYWSFTVENAPPGDFDLTAPPDGAVVTEPVTLDWQDSVDPGRMLAVGAGSSRTSADTGLSKFTRSITYDVWYATDPSFDPHDEVTELTDSTYTFPDGVLSDGTTYYWKVRATDGWDETWSGPDPYWSFTVDNELDIPVTKFSAESARNGVELTWECADPGVGFNLYRSEEATGVRSRLREIINVELITGESPYTYLDAGVSDGVTYSYWLEAIDAGGASETFGPATCTAGMFVPSSYALYQSRPNPARGTAVIAFDLPEDAGVVLTIYDLSGRKVTTLVNETLPAGAYERPVAGFAPGVYVYRLAAGEFSGVKKMVVVE
jgi:hypothetical protein